MSAKRTPKPVVDEKGYCPSAQSKGWDWRARNPNASCMLCGKWVRVTKNGVPYRHKPI